MCGIAGFIDPTVSDPNETCARMTRAIEHRGPDDVGLWIDRGIGLALGHRRLSIVDLSPAGHQPMQSAGGRYIIVFNGEIYNHAEIRTELEGRGATAWRGHSDTETLLAAIEAWGVSAALQRCIGMFAFAVWDSERRRLILARDRAGEKPIYYGRSGRAFLFGSELKALRAHPAFDNTVDRGSLALLLRHCYVPEPRSIFSGVHKLPPGTFLEVDAEGRFGEPVAYWSLPEVVQRGRARPFTGNDTEAVDELERVLGAAVSGQMVADVPLGAFLSGGVDSSVVVALMQKRSSRPVRTFTIGFTEVEYNEAGFARAVADHLGTQHTELIVTPADTLAVIPRLPTIYDEPFADSSQIPTFLVSQLARQHVTVSLSGDAGDELFCGYSRYQFAKRVWGGISRTPQPLRALLASTIRTRSPEAWTRTLNTLQAVVPRRWRREQMGQKLHTLANTMGNTRDRLYLQLMSHWNSPANVLVDTPEPASQLTELMDSTRLPSFEEEMMYWDFLTYLPGDILTKVDRAGMAVSLESRVPMLDHRVIEFAWTLPLHMRERAGESKWILKHLLARHVPRALTDRPKVGFGIPIDLWLRGPLRDWAEALLDESRLRREGFFQPAPIREKWQEHLSGRRNWAYLLWDVLMFQAWWEAQAQSVVSSAVRPDRVARTCAV